jgi:hypothetical protein
MSTVDTVLAWIGGVAALIAVLVIILVTYPGGQMSDDVIRRGDPL